ncbi:MAG: AraC family transcriptional regulator [Alphaproteobacteria bacterium]|nr:AraC family transcriptional regulator [Alphaproteobacteria bacterium]
MAKLAVIAASLSILFDRFQGGTEYFRMAPGYVAPPNWLDPMLDTNLYFDSMHAFYSAAYSETLVEVNRPVALGTTLLSARQGAGDYSDAAVPDLVITRGLSREIPATLDLGAGQFRAAIPRNSIVVTPPNTPTKILLDRPNEVEFLAIPYTALQSICGGHDLPPDGDFGAAHRANINCPQLTVLFIQTAREIRAGNPSGPMFIEGALMQMVALLMAQSQRKLRAPTGGLAPWQLSRVSDHLHARVDQPVSLADLAALTGLSVYHFARAFKASTGIAPHQFQVSLRMDRARMLLSRSTLTITEIALSLGYDSSQSFARAFRIAHGTTPTCYRTNMLGCRTL